NIPTVYVFNAATFVWSALLVIGIRPRADRAEEEAAPEKPAQASTPTGGFLAEATAGYREILGSRDLRTVIALYCAQTVAFGAAVVFQVSIALGLLGLSHSGLGYLNAMLGVGGLIGGVVPPLAAPGGDPGRAVAARVFCLSAPPL